MQRLFSNIFRYALWLVVTAFFGSGLFFRCASPLAPQGGPKDSLPPRVIDIRPPFGTLHFDEKRIFIEFDEYLALKDLSKEFFTSPRMSVQPLVTLRGRGIQIDLKDTLLPNTTYALNFGNSVADNNEGNVLSGFRFVFSTGDRIDSLLMSGYTVNAYSKDSVAKAFVWFYDTTIDSAVRITPEYDSTLLLRLPQVVGRGETNGIFITENLRPVPYRIYAFADANGNQTYDPGTDLVAFLDSVYNPATMPPFDIWFDTTRNFIVADPQLYFRLFMDGTFKRQYLASSSRPIQHKAMLNFGANHPQIEKLTFEGIDSSQVIVEYLTPTKDTIAYWFHVPSEQLPDTIRAEIVYMRHDSLNRLEPFTQELNLVWKFFDTRGRRERREEERAVEDSVALPNPFKYQADVQGQLNPEKEITFTFDYPLMEVDTSRFELIRKEEERMYRVRFRFERDTSRLRNWALRANWQPGQQYDLMIPAGAFTNLIGESNDTIRSSFTTLSPEKFATLVIGVTGKSPESEYVLQILQAGGQLIREIRHVRTGQYTFRYLNPGTVVIRVVEDDNRNGVWDRGDLIQRIQPERVEIFIPDNGNEQIATKENWEIEFEIDMNKLFAPVTMESVLRELQRKEALRLQQMEEARLKRLQQQKNAPAEGQQGGGFGIGTGLQGIRDAGNTFTP